MACGPVFSAETMASTANHVLDSLRILFSNLLFVDRYGSIHHFSIAHVSYGCSFSGRNVGSFDENGNRGTHLPASLLDILLHGNGLLDGSRFFTNAEVEFHSGAIRDHKLRAAVRGNRWNICSRSWIPNPQYSWKPLSGGDQQTQLRHVRFPPIASVCFRRAARSGKVAA